MEAISDLVRNLLSKRNVASDADISAFLNPDYLSHTHDPFLISGMDVAVERLLRAIAAGERIAVYADFDCDGIPGAALLSDFFKKIGYENFEVYLPHRDREGYGFHIEAIKALAAREVKLIITVDVGTVAFDPVRASNDLGIDVIVTDHHEPQEKLPEALAILNPKIAPYPFPHLCGAAMAFKLVQATLMEGKKRSLAQFAAIPDGWEKWLLDLVAIATIADMVSLVGENRALAYWGLSVLRKSPRPGISALCNANRLRKEEITENDIGFTIAPRINAASRMDEPALALQLLTTQDPAEAEQLAAKLESLNTRRKGVVAAVVKEAKRRTRERFSAEDLVVVLGNPEWKPALLGLAANSIMGDRGGVVCLWGRDANGKLKGSCRSDGALSVVDLFANATGAFEEYGGHAASGGFSVSHEHVHDLQETLARAAAAMAAAAPSDPLVPRSHDARIALSDISWSLYKEVSRLAPFGVGNPKPTFLISGVVIASTKRFGKESNHIEVTLGERGSIRAFDFFKSPENFSQAPVAGERANILATLERDSFRGPARLALRLVDILPS
jgi:single-stranded-DNA-specific exonuclease